MTRPDFRYLAFFNFIAVRFYYRYLNEVLPDGHESEHKCIRVEQ